MSFARKNTPCKTHISDEPSLTQKHLQMFTDVSSMIERALNGDMSVFRSGGMYIDVTSAPENLQQACENQIRLNSLWADLPVDVRTAYGTPLEFVKALHDPSQRERLIKLGVFENQTASPEAVEQAAKAAVEQAAKAAEKGAEALAEAQAN